MFLKSNGFDYILRVFMDKQISSNGERGEFQSQFELKHVAFLLKLLRIFIMAAFSTTDDSSIYTVVSLVRRQSTQDDNKMPEDSGSRFKELQKLMAGPIGESIISQIDYKQLQHKILTVISQILTKETMIFEDKLIIENALSLLVGCILHKNELLSDLYTFTSPSISSCEEFVLSGLLYCP
jgi:hypothetical protein